MGDDWQSGRNCMCYILYIREREREIQCRAKPVSRSRSD